MADDSTITRFTPTERRILAILSDGKPHERKELQTCLNDDLARPQVIRSHISRLRPKLDGMEIIAYQHNKKICYRLIKS